MTDHHVYRFAGRRGSFALEAALAVPPLIVVLLFLASMMLSVQAEMRLKTAVDRTAAEIALLPPIIFSLIDESDIRLPVADLLTAGLPGGQGNAEGDTEGDKETGGSDGMAGQLRSGILDIIKPDKLEALVNDAALDLASSVLFANFVNARVRYWQQRLGASRLLGPPSAWLDWNMADDQLYLEIDYTVRTLLGSIERRCTAFVPIWRSQDGKKRASAEQDSIWKLDNFTRGKKLRDKYGGNLPSNYPVIARFEDGEALSIKSMDLTKPTYADPEAVTKRVTEQIDALAGFSGTAKPFGRDAVWIRAEQIESRRLLLIVPGDGDLNRYAPAIAALTRDAAARGVTLEIVTHGKAKAAKPSA